MRVRCTGTARLRIARTGESVEVTPRMLQWQEGGGSEDTMGPGTRYAAVYEFVSRDSGSPFAVSWLLSEYPHGTQNHKSTEATAGIEVLQDFDFQLVAERPTLRKSNAAQKSRQA